MNRAAVLLPGILFSVCAAAALGQSQPASQAQSNSGEMTKSPLPVFRSNAQEVVLDMVFRDKRGKPVRDISQDQVHVFENGVEQHLNSFSLIENATNPPEAPVPQKGSVPVDPMREIRTVTLVFEGLDGDGKRFFRQALQDILNTAPEQNLYFSVYVVDQYLHCLQPFTNNHDDLVKAVDRSMAWSFIQYSHNSEQIKSKLQNILSQGEPTLQGGAAGPPNPSAVQSMVNYRMAKMQYDMLQLADMSDREYGARADIDALLDIVRAESQLPGRKVILYFNPSLFVPEIAKEQFSYMVSAANRSNVSFYTVDPKGLVTWNQSGEGHTELSGAVGEIQQQQMNGGGLVSPAGFRIDETAENAIRSDPRLWLSALAGQTGGVAITDTNDLKAPLRTVIDEVRSYYEASYDPHVATYDGSFRKISVRVDRPGVVVVTRSGYYAVPQLNGGQQLQAFEVPMLNALSAATPPTGLDFQAAAERFSQRGPKVQYMVTLEAPLKELAFTTEPDHKTALMDAALLAVLKNSSGDIVDKFSKDFAVQVDASKIEDYRKGNLQQSFPTEIAPGTYTLEAVMMDRNGKKMGVKRSTLTVPATSNGLAISDVVVVRRTDTLKDDQIVNPFYFPGGKVVPTLDTTLKGGAGNILPFYFAVYPDPAIKDAPTLNMAFYKGGQYLGAASAPLPPAQKDGRIPYIADLPADKFTPGSYEIRLGIKQGSSSVEQSIDFQVE